MAYQIKDYAGIHTEDNAIPSIISLVNSWFKVTIFDIDMPSTKSVSNQATNDITIGQSKVYDVTFHISGEAMAGNKTFQYTVYEIGTAVNITAITQATTAILSASGHGLSNGDELKIADVVGMTEVNDRIFTVAGVSGADFELQDDGGTGIDSSGFTAWSSGGTVQKATATITHSHRRYAQGGGGDFGSTGDGAIVNLTKGNKLELYVKGTTDTTSFVFETVGLIIR